jgi:tRNA G18 (ribose-2'-O)-methylase SpoU
MHLRCLLHSARLGLRRCSSFRPSSRNGQRRNGPHRSAPRQSGPPKEVIYGIHPCSAALALQSRKKLETLWVQKESGNKRGGWTDVSDMARSRGVEVVSATKHELNLMLGNRGVSHQGLVLGVHSRPVLPLVGEESLELKEESGRLSWAASFRGPSDEPMIGVPSSSYPLIVVLDEVQDPHNLGSALRSCLFLVSGWE